MSQFVRELVCSYRRVRVEKDHCTRRLASSADVREYFSFLELADRERFVVVHLSTKNTILSHEVVSIGTLNGTLVHPREVFKGAFLSNAASIILMHNHTSGDPIPSPEDREVTDRLVAAGEIVGVRVLDHVIIGDGRYYSFADAGTLTGGKLPGVGLGRGIRT